MSYFKKVKKGDQVFGLIFGLGTVKNISENGYYHFNTEFDGDYEVAYTDDGIPNWGKFKEQTLFFKDDIDLTDYDFSASNKLLTSKKIIKLLANNKLEVRLPSGIWHICNKRVKEYSKKLLKNETYHLFRKQEDN
ncbi:MAG TPA: hypothetical protein EYG73_00580 [Arcobacter sp.]|nr:hypothetical protein [Arcobacter sp.]